MNGHAEGNRPPAPSFEEALGLGPMRARRRALVRQLRLLKGFIVLLATAAIVVGLYPSVVQWRSAQRMGAVAASSEQEVASWPPDKASQMLAAAQDYNARLAASGQPQLGEGADPFTASDGVGGTGTGGTGAPSDSATTTSDASPSDASYADYTSQLAGTGGVMGTVRVPKISVDLPIYHGTSDAALAAGAGHLYGTSLPVGGASTHVVLTGHRGLATAQMFTRLNELREGDYMYMTVLGVTMAYEVDSITVIEPTDSSRLRIVPGEDRLTLMTCTPYGVNTHRLLVSGHRVPYPASAPEPSAVADGRRELHVVWAVLAVGAVLVLAAERRRNRWLPRHHAAE
ncbi:MAG: class C sortase [Bifidobacteriaceae bacterium]|nr:class C sortase [Bifidobacteriaceae bacterium]